MNPRSTLSRTLLGLALGASMAACTTVPKVLYHEYPLDARMVQYYAIKAPGDTETYDFHMRVCNLSQTGELSNCKDTLVLQNVHPATL